MIYNIAIIVGVLGFLAFGAWVAYMACRRNKGGFWTNR